MKINTTPQKRSLKPDDEGSGGDIGVSTAELIFEIMYAKYFDERSSSQLYDIVDPVSGSDQNVISCEVF